MTFSYIFISNILMLTALAFLPSSTAKNGKARVYGTRPHCRDFEFVVKRSEITRYYDSGSGQETSYAPIYSFEDGYTNLQLVGRVERKVQFLNKVDSSEGAMLWLSQSFEYDRENSVFKSQ